MSLPNSKAVPQRIILKSFLFRNISLSKLSQVPDYLVSIGIWQGAFQDFPIILINGIIGVLKTLQIIVFSIQSTCERSDIP